jgi:hypothetical protein
MLIIMDRKLKSIRFHSIVLDGCPMLINDIKVTTEILLKGAFIFALVDLVYLPMLQWRVKADFFRQLKWLLVLVTGLVWFVIWKLVLDYFWEDVYSHVFPLWMQPWIPFVFGLLMAGISLLLWRLALKFPRHPVLVFCMLGGVWGIITHTWAIQRGILTKPPMLQGASPLAALVIAFFEYIFYWCVISTLAALMGWILSRLRSK